MRRFVETPAEQLALLGALVAEMRDAVLAETDDGRVAVVNAAFRALFAVDERTPVDGPRLVSRVREQLADPADWVKVEAGSAELKLADGRVLEHERHPVRLDDERTIVVRQFRDVTARRQAEAEIVTSRHRLRELSAHLDRVREEERRELARSLHDEVGQLLTGIRLEIASAVDRFRSAEEKAPAGIVDRLQAAVGMVDLSLATVRRITTELRPPMLDHLGLVSTARWEAALFEQRTGIRCRISTVPATFETREHVTVLYRILLEALTNVARHANAGTVWIRIRGRASRVILEVRDNGRGITDEAIAHPSLGLLGIRERALAAGGDLRITRPRGGGTSVTVSLPVAPTPAPEEPPR